MSDYKAPLRDMQFALNDVLKMQDHYSALANGGEATPEFVSMILNEFAKFAEEVIAPLNQNADKQGCKLENGTVSTPDGFKEAYAQYVEAGWQSLSIGQEHGGQGLPPSLGIVLSEMHSSACIAWAVFIMAASGAMKTLIAHGSEEQNNLYLRKLAAGDWTGTMCLTEPHCGTDLGLLRTAAEPQDDGSYLITGNKIFISTGDHDLAENIVHIVLARIQGAPKGTKGISLFIIPKVISDEAGNLLARNQVSCGGLEEKMGMHGNPTCSMNFDGARGYLLGKPNKGLEAMFVFMNAARIGAAIQGTSHAEVGLQKSLAYAQERLQMRSLSGAKNPEGPADPIIVHPDVRRMLLTQKAFAEGTRMFNYFMAFQLDKVSDHPDAEAREEAQALLDLLTPIGKAFGTEAGLEAAKDAIQCFGGHGYIQEWGVEQNYRDARIGTIWEGTTGIQANDLLGRKILASGGANLKRFIEQIRSFCHDEQSSTHAAKLIKLLAASVDEWESVTATIAHNVQRDPEELGAASVNYMMLSGYVCLAYLWARAAVVAGEKIDAGDSDSDFYQSKIHVANFYFDHILIRSKSLVAGIEAGASNLMALDAQHFWF